MQEIQFPIEYLILKETLDMNNLVVNFTKCFQFSKCCLKANSTKSIIIIEKQKVALILKPKNAIVRRNCRSTNFIIVELFFLEILVNFINVKIKGIT